MRRIGNLLEQATVRERAQEFEIWTPFVAISDYVTMQAQYCGIEQNASLKNLKLKRLTYTVSYCVSKFSCLEIIFVLAFFGDSENCW